MTRSTTKIIGWVLSILLAAFLCLASAIPKFIDFPNKAEMFAKMGWSTDVMFYIGFVEIFIALLFLIPRAAFIAAILLSAYLGGATATHFRIGEANVFPIITGIVVWIALGLRDPRVFGVAFHPPETAESKAV